MLKMYKFLKQLVRDLLKCLEKLLKIILEKKLLRSLSHVSGVWHRQLTSNWSDPVSHLLMVVTMLVLTATADPCGVLTVSLNGKFHLLLPSRVIQILIFEGSRLGKIKVIRRTGLDPRVRVLRVGVNSASETCGSLHNTCQRCGIIT